MTSCSSLIPSEAGRISSLLTSSSLDCKVVTKILNDKMPVTKVPRLGKRKGGRGCGGWTLYDGLYRYHGMAAESR